MARLHIRPPRFRTSKADRLIYANMAAENAAALAFLERGHSQPSSSTHPAGAAGEIGPSAQSDDDGEDPLLTDFLPLRDDHLAEGDEADWYNVPEEQDVVPANKHAPTPLEKQRLQLAKLLQDPTREIQLPKPPKEKSLRPPREMMKNVQGSSAGAGSGEFHVYKQSRRREYERLRLMDEQEQKEKERVEFEQKQAELRERADSKTSQNRQKRQKRKQSRLAKKADKAPGAVGPQTEEGADERSDESEEEADGKGKGKKRKLGAAPVAEGMVFKQPTLQDDEDSDSDNDGDGDPGEAEPANPQQAVAHEDADEPVVNPVVEPKGLTIVEDDW